MAHIASSLALLVLATACATAPETSAPQASSQMAIDAPLVQIVALKHVDAEEVAAAIRELPTAKGLTLKVNAATNSVVIQGDTKLVKRTSVLIANLDKPQ